MPKTRAKKIYTIILHREARKPTEYSGTLKELIAIFSYTLSVGHSWNMRISQQPKNIKRFLSALQKSFEEKEACCYNRTIVELKKNKD